MRKRWQKFCRISTLKSRQTFRSGQRIRGLAQTLDHRALHRLAQSLPKARQGLGKPQPKGTRVLAPRLNPPHAQKALQSGLKSPDRLLGSKLSVRTFAVALVAVGLAGCSGDVTRLDENPFHEKPQTTSSLSQKVALAPERRGGRWTWDGGTPLTLAPSDTLDGIAHRYQVPVAAIIEVNNITAPNAIRAGQHLVVPRYSPDPGLRSASAPGRGVVMAARSKIGFKNNWRSAEATTIGATTPGEKPAHGTADIRSAKETEFQHRSRMSNA